MSEHIWIYHERQQALLCGQHALNNLVQACSFSPDSLAEIGVQLDEMELQMMAQNNEGGLRSKEYLARVAEVRSCVFDFCVLTNRCVHCENLRFNSNSSDALDAMRIFLSSLLLVRN